MSDDASVKATISRRDLLKSGAALGLAAPILPGILKGRSPGARVRPRAAAGRGGILRLGTSDNFTSFSPWQDDQGNYALFNNLYSQPLRDTNQLNADKPLMWLAESFQIAPNARSVTVKLRPGITFHSGYPLDAEALIANWKAISNPALSNYAGNWVPFIGEAKRIDHLTARLDFKAPTAPALVTELHARMSLVSPPLLAKGPKAMLTEADGTGAFRLKHYEPNVVAVLERNPKFFLNPLPYLNEIQLRYFSDPNAMVAALESGELDFAYDVPPQSVASLKGRFTIMGGPASIADCVLANCQSGHPFASLQARHALQHLINRDRFNQVALFGTGTPTQTFAPPGSLAWKPSLAKTFPYDPQLAQSMFKSLGLIGSSQPIRILQLTGIIPAIGLNASLLAQEMQAIGVNAQLEPADVGVWLDKFKGSQAGDFDLMTSSDGTVNRYPILQTAGNTGSKVASNPLWAGGVPPANYINAINQATFAVTPAQQQHWCQTFETIQQNESFDIAVAYQRTQYAFSKKLTGFMDGRDDWLILDHMKYT
jgi:peptide/nickel transport system substrate-binding protein